ncbi:hypothetical protein BJV77DRAFT_1050980 [Russula vinacea]|nr:hypothetical protein BJV77DRAFT_1050980 [Russula vinacea]
MIRNFQVLYRGHQSLANFTIFLPHFCYHLGTSNSKQGLPQQGYIGFELAREHVALRESGGVATTRKPLPLN